MSTQNPIPKFKVSLKVSATSETARRRLHDRLFSRWIDRAPRFGAVAAHFPESLRRRRFTASFWAPEMFFANLDAIGGGSRSWYLSGGTRSLLDRICSRLIREAPPGHEIVTVPWLPGKITAESLDMVGFGCWQDVDTGKPRFWSPELPEVLPTQNREQGWSGIWIKTGEASRTGGHVWRGAGVGGGR